MADAPGTASVVTTHPSGCYYANPLTVSVQRQCNPLLATALAAGGYFGNDGTPANATNAFTSFNEALDAAKGLNKAVTGGAGALTGPGSSAVPGIGGALTGVNAIGDLAQRLTQAHTWVRVGEFVAGGLLLYMGGNAIIRGTAAGAAAKTVKGGAKTAAKVVAR